MASTDDDSNLTASLFTETPTEATTLSWSRLIALCLAALPSFLFRAFSFLSITLPTAIYRMATWTVTLNLSFGTLIFWVIFIIIVTYIIIRYRFLTKYSRLAPIETSKSALFDLSPDISAPQDDFPRPGFKNYPDEYLSALLSSIKIFGYLEQPVFHELARHLQTRKLLAGDVLFRTRDQERNFYIVIDGCVQVLTKDDPPRYPEDDHRASRDLDEVETDGRQLLNEVRAGGTLSSLFSILALFTEDPAAIRGEEEFEMLKHLERGARAKGKSHTGQPRIGAEALSREGSLGVDEWADGESYEGRRRSITGRNRARSPLGRSVHGKSGIPDNDPSWNGDVSSGTGGTVEEDADIDIEASQPLSPSHDNFRLRRSSNTPAPSSQRSARVHTHNESFSTTSGTSPTAERAYPFTSVHPNIIARATVDSTLAVIPSEAFHRLTEKFPNAVAHIVQVIMTRFQRVTFLTAHRYLGLTNELLRVEKMLNEVASGEQLPPDFWKPGGLDRFRRWGAEGMIKPSASGDEEEDIRSISLKDGRNERENSNKTKNNESGKGNIGRKRSQSGSRPLIHSRMHSYANLVYQDDLELYHSDHTSDKKPGSAAARRPTRAIRRFDNNLTLTMSPKTETPVHPWSLSPLTISPKTASESSSTSNMPRKFHSGVQDFDEEDETHLYEMVASCMARGIGLNTRPPVPSPSPSSSSRNILSSRPRSGGSSLGDSNFDDLETSSISSATSADSERDSFPQQKRNQLGPDDIEISFFSKGNTVMKEGERNGGLFFVIDGLLDVTMGSAVDEDEQDDNITPTSTTSTEFLEDEIYGDTVRPKNSARHRRPSDDSLFPTKPRQSKKSINQTSHRPLFMIKPGGLAGYLTALSGTRSLVNLRASTDTYVGYISEKTLERIVERNPTVLLTLARRLIALLSPLLLRIDFALEWVQIPAGHVLYRRGDSSDSIYIVLNGRLRATAEKTEGIDIAEYGQGDSVGELEVLTGTRRPYNLHAIRDTELARMPKTLFNALAVRRPEITMQISRLIANRMRVLLQGTLSSSNRLSPFSNGDQLFGRNNVNLRTVGILPINSLVPVGDFGQRLRTALKEHVGASSILLNSATVTSVLGRHAFSRMGKLKLANWLADQEERYRIVLYVADGGFNSQWTQTCIKQADCIFLVGLGSSDPGIGEYERIWMKTTARKELVLLHGERHFPPGITKQWLKSRSWIQAHHHVHMPLRKTAAAPPPFIPTHRKNTLSSIKNQVRKYYSVLPGRDLSGRLLELVGRVPSTTPGLLEGNRGDFARLARRLCGKSIGVVLGGGGARGISQIGVIRAMEEAGIPIDIIGGTSIGSFVGGLYARDMNHVSVYGRAKFFSGRVASPWRQLMDLTYPVAAWFTGHEFNRSIWKCFGETMIEDFWLPYFTNTTNITWSRMDVHTTGYAWRYIRASMSLSGFIPPLCEKGDMLVDGGYMDNLPVSVAKNMGADMVIAVDVASADDTSPVYYGDSLSGWWALMQGFNPFLTYKMPSIADIQSRLAYVSSVKQLEDAKMTPGCIYVRVPVQSFKTLEFNRFDEIYRTGYEYGKATVEKWRKDGTLKLVMGMLGEEKETDVKMKEGRRNSI